MAMSAVYSTFCGQIVHQNVGGILHDLIADLLGSTAALIDSTGAILGTYEDTPYVEIEKHSGTDTPSNFVGTLGYYRDMLGSALTYIRARWYKSLYGRWMTVDPLWPEETAYGYVNGTPTIFGDPAGLSCGHDCEKSCDAFFKANPDFCKHTPPSPPYPPNSVVMAVAFCCNGKPYQCFCPGQKPKNPYVLACVIVHERGHIIPGVSCPPGYTGIPSKFRIECEALKSGIKCAKEQCKNIISNNCIELDEWRCFECRRLKDACSPMPPKSWLSRYCDGCGIL